MPSRTVYACLAGLGFAALAWMAPARAADTSQVARGERLFRTTTCVSCHGVDAKSPISPKFPKLAGQNREYVLQQLRDIKRGWRTNGNSAPMRDVLALLDDEDMQAVAAYLSTLTP